MLSFINKLNLDISNNNNINNMFRNASSPAMTPLKQTLDRLSVIETDTITKQNNDE